jgi:eukaryotic-like serine/threonine-protein kinase
MGTVFEAVHLELGKRVAIKVLTAFSSRHDDASARFLREARAASAVESEHIVHVFDVGEDLNAGLYMVMEVLKGEDLATRLEKCGRLSSQEAGGIVWQVSLALERAHAVGIVHRDLKPANVFLTNSDDGSINVKVLDFGIAKLLRDAQGSSRSGITKGGTAIGTPQYMSPEQAEGLPSVDARSDLYSLGALLYECITGRPPYEELSSYEQTILKILMEPPPRPSARVPGIAPAMEQLIMQLMAREPAARPASLGAVRARLTEIHPVIEARRLVLGAAEVALAAPCEPLPPTAGGLAIASRETEARGRRRSVFAGAAAAVAVIGVGLAMLSVVRWSSPVNERSAAKTGEPPSTLAAPASPLIPTDDPVTIAIDPPATGDPSDPAPEPMPPSTATAADPAPPDTIAPVSAATASPEVGSARGTRAVRAGHTLDGGSFTRARTNSSN